ncbi:MAG: glycosyltransferase family 1 protein [Candidatus Methanoperedens sp.]
MEVLFDNSIFQLQRYGGISRYFYELITRLSGKEDMEINLFEGFHVNEYGLSNHKSDFSLYKGYKVPEIKYTGDAFEIINKLWFDKIYSKSNFDIYHPTYYRRDLNKFKKSPIVLTVYDMIHELYSGQFRDGKSVIEAKKISIDSADIIICISENTKKDLIRMYNIPENKIKVVYLANSLQSSKSIPFKELEIKYNIKKPYILHVGVRGGYKNFSLLLDVYTSHFSDKFDLVCFGENRLEIIKRSNLLKNVFHVNGPDNLLASLYQNAFCLVYPSLYEGFGIPLLESMAMGCPVIASNTSSIPEVVGDGGILFDPRSQNELIHAIESLYDESNRSKLINLGFEQEKKFSWEKTANETLEVYRIICSVYSQIL